jgi:small subunit ribosomal protein S17e
MGRIRSTLIKRTGGVILAKNPDKFKDDFQTNKLNLKEAADIHSKKLRNVIAGYIAHLYKKESKKKSIYVKKLEGV